MLLKTYEKITGVFYENSGYMSYEKLKECGITASQIQELLEKGMLEKFARGWYWCSGCGLQRPVYHKYVEICLVNPGAVICMESACFLHGLIQEEPKVISVATERSDRRKMEFAFPVVRYYLQNTGLQDEIQEVKTEFGTYRVYSEDRTVCDCIRMRNRISSELFLEIENGYRNREHTAARLEAYARKLRALKCIRDLDWSES